MKHSYLQKVWFLLFFLVSCCLNAAAQTGGVAGRIVDENKQALPGVTVLIEGTQLGSSTNAEGQYLIQNVPVGQQTVVASFVGYSTQRIPVTVVAGQTANVPNITLGENTTLLNEAVVIGYGTQRRQDLTGAVEQISEKQFVKGQITNPEQLVQGKVAGVQITTNSGQPGAGSQIRIRGGSSLTASNDPLIVIDGVPVDNAKLDGAANPLSLINPNDIEAITVLKDASATAIYGSRASNGVIIVTTKRGLQGEALRINVSTQNSLATVAKYTPVLSADEFRELVRSKGTTAQIATLGDANTDWQKEIYRTAFTSDNNVSLMGSKGKVPIRVSAGYLNQQGLLKNNDLNRFSGAIAVTPLLFNDRLRVDLNVKGSVIRNNFSAQDAVGAAVAFDPTQPIRSDDPRYAPFGGYFEYVTNNTAPFQLNNLSPRNPVAQINLRDDQSTVRRSIGNAQFDYKLPFVDGLSANLNLGYDIQRGKGTLFIPEAAALAYRPSGGGTNNQYRRDLNNLLLETFAKYQRQLGPGNVDLVAGYSWQQFQNKFYRFANNLASGEVAPGGEASPTYNGSLSGTNQYILLSYFGRANYNIADKYLFTGTFRADGSSRFGSENRWGYFPSASVAWRIKGENFLKNSTAVSDLKIRASYGLTGQQDIGDLYYAYLALLTPSQLTSQYQFGNTFLPTLRPDQYNPRLKWETTTTTNLGLDYGFANGRVYGSVDVYQRDTKDLLNNINIGPLEGLSNAGIFNVGSLTNKGIELVTNVEVVKSEQFNATLNFNGNYNRNRITRLTRSDSPDDVGVLTGGISGGVGNNVQVNSVNFPTQSFYVLQQVYDQNGKPIEGVYVDRNGDGVINSSDNYRYKSARPDYVLGAGGNLSYGNASFAFTFRSNIGNYVYNNVRSSAFYDATTSGFVVNRNPEVLESNFTTAQYFSDYYVENASFLRLENVTLGYNFGSVVGNNSNFGVSFAVQNVFVATKYKGVDPEVGSGIDNTIYPRPRTYTVGLNFGF
jgi:iron complex outermembrane receptor protein